MIDKGNKGRHFDIVGLIIEIFVYSLALPFALILASALGGLASEFYSFLILIHPPYLFYGVSIGVGIGLKIWRDNRRKTNRQND